MSAKKTDASPSSPTIRQITLPRSGRTVSYELERKSVKNLNLRVRRDGTMHLSIPRRTTIAVAEAFLIKQEDWILATIAKVEARAEAHPAISGQVGDTLPYLGTTLSIRWETGSPARVQIDRERNHLNVYLSDPADPEQRMRAVEAFEKNETARLVSLLVARYHPFFAPRGVEYPKEIRVKHIKSRFGSCAPKVGSLNFASKLCEFPMSFVEYVVVHELCHFLVPNHSAAFWEEVERVLPDYPARKELGKK